MEPYDMESIIKDRGQLKVKTFYGSAVTHIEDNGAIRCMCVQFVLHDCLLTWLSYRVRKFHKIFNGNNQNLS